MNNNNIEPFINTQPQPLTQQEEIPAQPPSGAHNGKIVTTPNSSQKEFNNQEVSENKIKLDESILSRKCSSSEIDTSHSNKSSRGDINLQTEEFNNGGKREFPFTVNPSRSFTHGLETNSLNSAAENLNIIDTDLLNEVSWEYCSGALQYAEHLSTQYPKEKYTLMTLGKQCYMVNAALELILPENEVSSRLLQCNVEDLTRLETTLNDDYVDRALSHILPSKEQMEGKILVISRNLACMETMSSVIKIMERHMEKTGIQYMFDFTVSETSATETPTKLKFLQDNKNVRISVVPDAYQAVKMDEVFREFMRMNPAVKLRRLFTKNAEGLMGRSNQRICSILAKKVISPRNEFEGA